MMNFHRPRVYVQFKRVVRMGKSGSEWAMIHPFKKVGYVV